MGSRSDKWELEEYSFKREKVTVIETAAFFPTTVFFRAKMAALPATTGRARSWLWGGGEFGGEARSTLLPPRALPAAYRKGEVFDRLLEC